MIDRKKQTKLNRIKRIFYFIVLLGFILHILFYFLTSFFLITSGVFLIIGIALLFYFVIFFTKRLFHLNFNIQNVKILFVSVSVFLIILELVFIISGYKSTYSEKKDVFYYQTPYSINKGKGQLHLWSRDHNLVSSEYCYNRKVNSEGLSDNEHTVRKNPNQYRIIGLGDSFTEGDGAHVDSTWLKFLERDLVKYPMKRELDFFNAGVCGSDPFFEYLLLKKVLLKYEPDLVLIAINTSDIFDIIARGGMERFQPDGSVKYSNIPFWQPLFAISHLSRLVFSWLGYDELLLDKDEISMNNANNRIVESINMFYILSEKADFKILVIFHPLKSEIDYGEFGLSQAVNKIKSQKLVDFLDLLEYFRSKEHIDSTNSANYFWKYDGHHNAKGYELFAKGVEWKLNEMGIIDSLKKD
jgi:hypothetical protein